MTFLPRMMHPSVVVAPPYDVGTQSKNEQAIITKFPLFPFGYQPNHKSNPPTYLRSCRRNSAGPTVGPEELIGCEPNPNGKGARLWVIFETR